MDSIFTSPLFVNYTQLIQQHVQNIASFHQQKIAAQEKEITVPSAISNKNLMKKVNKSNPEMSNHIVPDILPDLNGPTDSNTKFTYKVEEKEAALSLCQLSAAPVNASKKSSTPRKRPNSLNLSTTATDVVFKKPKNYVRMTRKPK